MKPMVPESYGYQGTKQATGIQIFSEQLPKIEGMPTQRGPAPALVPMFPVVAGIPRTGLISVIEPALEFSQTSAIRQQQATRQEPILGKISFVSALPASSLKVASAILQGQQSEQVLAQFSAISSLSASQTQQSVRETVRSRDILYGLDLARTTDLIPETRQDISLIRTPSFDIATKITTTPKTTITTVPFITQIITPWREPPPPVTTPPFGTLPPGGGGSPFGKKRRRNFLETFWMGLDVAGPILKPPKGMQPPKLKRSGIPGGRQKVKVTRRKKK